MIMMMSARILFYAFNGAALRLSLAVWGRVSVVKTIATFALTITYSIVAITLELMSMDVVRVTVMPTLTAKEIYFVSSAMDMKLCQAVMAKACLAKIIVSL